MLWPAARTIMSALEFSHFFQIADTHLGTRQIYVRALRHEGREGGGGLGGY